VLLGAAGLGVSLVQIHIYMTPVKRTLQVRPVQREMHSAGEAREL
jgi:uncharacterized integral membrane protein